MKFLKSRNFTDVCMINQFFRGIRLPDFNIVPLTLSMYKNLGNSLTQ